MSAWLSGLISGVADRVLGVGRLRVAIVAVVVGVFAFAFAATADERAAAPTEKLSNVAPKLPPGVDPESLPLAGGRGMETLLEVARREKERVEERERQLASPELQEQRERSRTKHLGVLDDEAEGLVREKFGERLAGAAMGAGFDQLADGRSVRTFVDDYTVVLEGDGDRPPVLLESPWPLRAEGDDGRKQPVDLSLRQVEGGFEPTNAATDVVLPAELSSGIRIGQIGAVPEGAAEGVPADDDDWVFYGNAQMDTDVVVTPLARGAEVFWQLRSPRAAEQLTLALELPEGAVVEETKAGSAVVTMDGKPLAGVTPPVAIDAQGQDVAVDMAVDHERLVLSVPHREADVAYPVLVDPVIEDYWLSTGSWFDQSTPALNRLDHWIPVFGGYVDEGDYIQRLHCYQPVSCDAAKPGYDYNKPDGLHIYAQPNPMEYLEGSYAEWVYLAPGDTTRIQEAGMYGFFHRRGGSPDPFMYTGIWSDALGGWASVDADTQDFNGQTIQHFAGSAAGPQRLTFGFATGQDVMNGWWRDGYIGAAIVALTDPEAPSIGQHELYRLEPPATAGQPHVWVARGSQWVRRSDQVAVRARITDPGLGVSRTEFSGAGTWDSFSFGCVGNYAALCPYTVPGDEANQMVTSMENTAEGISTAYLHAWDPLGHQTSVPVTMKVDDTRPTISLSGALWNGRETPAGSGTPVLGAGIHGLSIQADDPAPSSGTPTSGVEKIEIKLDGDVVYTDQGACPSGGCSRSLTRDLNTAVVGGRRTIRVVATDGAGNAQSKAFVVNLPTRGELVVPVDGEATSSRLALQAEAREDGFSGAEFQYREMPSGVWKTIGGVGTMLRDDQGNVVSGTSHPLDQPGRRTKKLIWNAREAIDLAMLTPKPGPFQVRAVFAGNGGHVSKAVNVELDRRGLSAGNAQTKVGPGTLDLLSGNFSYTATDAALSGFGQGLTLTRTYNSLDPEAGGGDAPMGQGWVMSSPVEGISDYSSLAELKAPGVEKWVDVFDSAGMRIRFELLADDSFKPEPGFEDLTLERGRDSYTLTDLDGTITTFSILAGSSEPVQFVPSSVQEAGQQGVSSFSYELHAGKPQLKRIIAPRPPGLGCLEAVESLPRGCKVLELDYGNIDLGPAGLYRRLKAIRHVAFDPATAAMKVETVAQFSYYEVPDQFDPVLFGRLKEAWDPRISPALKERYDYDAEGRIAEIAPPGEASWWMNYSPLSEVNPGKLNWAIRHADGSGMEASTVHWNQPVSGTGAAYDMSASELTRWGQTDRPTDATLVVDHAPGDGNYLLTHHYLNQDGREVNVVRPGLGTTTTEYDKHGNVVRELSAQNRVDALAAGAASATAAGLLSTYRTYSADGLRLVDELGPQREVRLDSGQLVDARAHTTTAYDEGSTLTPPAKPAHLPTTVTTGAQVDPSEPDEDVRVSKTEYDWTLRKPTAAITDAGPGGLNITHRTAYNTSGLETSSRMPKSNGTDAGTTLTDYYTHDGSSPFEYCRNRPEWHNLPCVTRAAAHPDGAGLPGVPLVTYAYDRFGQVVTANEYVSSSGGWLDTRFTTSTSDSAGRLVKTKVESTIGAAVEEVTTSYSASTGRPTTVSTPSGTLTTGYDNVGRPVSYTDANGLTSTTSYDRLNRPIQTAQGAFATQSRSYDTATGLLTELEDSDAGTFTASHDHDGRIVSKTYPNGLEAETTFDPVGAPTRLRYTKTSNCSSNCTWVDEQVSESIHGQWRTHDWELSSQEYSYDKVGRLTKVVDDVHSPSGVAGCTIRSYGFDLNSNRTALTTRAPDSGGNCQPGASGTQKSYSYDNIDRLTGSGLAYDSLGRMTSIPAAHSGGGVLSYSYHVNDQVRTISQDGVSKTYTLDPSGRHHRTVVSDGTTHTEHLYYADSSDSPTITILKNAQGTNVSAERTIEGIDGDLAAIRTADFVADTEETVLQLSNLHGDTIATASLDPQATQLLARFESDEYGNPRQPAGNDKRYGWLGGKQRRTELSSGVIQMGVRSYVPALGRFTSVDPVRGGSANDYDYANQDPVNTFDLDGRCPWCLAAVVVSVAVRTCMRYCSRGSKALKTAGRRSARAGRLAARGAVRAAAKVVRGIGRALEAFTATSRVGRALFGRGDPRSKYYFPGRGILNQGDGIRIGMSYRKADGREVFSIRWGRKSHFDFLN